MQYMYIDSLCSTLTAGSFSHFVSAKTDDLINSMFFRVTAEALGIKVDKISLERESTVVTAEIVKHKETPPVEVKPPDKGVRRTKSSFCTLQ